MEVLVADVAPRLFAAVAIRRRKKRTVQEALTNAWISDIQGARTVGFITDFFRLWGLLSDFEL